MRSRSIALLVVALTTSSLPAWGADNDPVPDVSEALVCGYPALASTINALPAPFGRCVTGTDYVNPAFATTACPDCTEETVVSFVDQPLLPAQEVPSVTLPPVGIPPQGPYSTPPVDQPVGTVMGFRDGQRYCVSVVPEAGGPVGQCVDVGPAAALIPPVGPTPLGYVPGQTVGPTPGLAEGALGSTPAEDLPATSVDLTVGIRWVESRLNQRLGPGLVNLWDPVDVDDPDAVQWWANNGDQTTLDVTLALNAGDETLQAVTVSVPYAGQALAALTKTV